MATNICQRSPMRFLPLMDVLSIRISETCHAKVSTYLADRYPVSTRWLHLRTHQDEELSCPSRDAVAALHRRRWQNRDYSAWWLPQVPAFYRRTHGERILDSLVRTLL